MKVTYECIDGKVFNNEYKARRHEEDLKAFDTLFKVHSFEVGNTLVISLERVKEILEDCNVSPSDMLERNYKYE